MADSQGSAQTRAKNKYNAKAYDSLRIVVKKGRKEIIKAHAEARGESINGFVSRAIDEAMARDAARCSGHQLRARASSCLGGRRC